MAAPFFTDRHGVVINPNLACRFPFGPWPFGPRKKLHNVMAVTEAPCQFRQKIDAWANPKVGEMAMKKNLVLYAAISLVTLWFAVDVGVTALTLLS
jgi:hypothetical protein